MEAAKKDSKILIVEDEAVIALDIKTFLGNYGFADVSIVSSGERAVSEALSSHPDLILMDVRLGDGMDGIHAAEEISAHVDIPIIFVTAHSDDSTLDRAKHVEPFGFIVKPIKEHDLYTAVVISLHRHAMEKKVRESEEKYRSLITEIQDGFYNADTSGVITDTNRKMVDMLGYSEPGDIVGMRVYDILDPDCLAQGTEDFNIVIKEGKTNRITETRIRRKDGSYVYVNIFAYPIKIGGSITGMWGMVRDVTPQRKAEIALRESERRYKDMAELLPQTLFEMDLNGFFTWVNRAGFESSGYSQEDLEKGLRAQDTMAPEERERVVRNMSGILDGSVVTGNEYKAVRKDGSTYHMLVYASPLVKNGKVSGLRGVCIDTSQQKSIMEALRRSEEKYRIIADNIADTVWTADLNLRFLYGSPSITSMLGYTPEEVAKREIRELATPESYEKAVKIFNEELESEKHPNADPSRKRTLDLEVLRKDGTIIPVEITVTFLRDQNGKPVRILGITRDISERKRAENTLRESEMRYRTLVEKADDVIGIIRKDGTIFYVNGKCIDVFGYLPKEMIGNNVTRYLAPDGKEQALENFAKRFSGIDVPDSYEVAILRKDGSIGHMEVRAGIVALVGEEFDMVICRDITERKKAEEKIRSSLKEKEILLKEVHHRVKNNMQIISSLLNLQADFLHDERDRELFLVCQNRVRAMALMHEKLYQSEDLSRINFTEFLGDLAGQIMEFYNFKSRKLKLSIQAEKIFLAIDVAIPCAQIVNELIVNAILHAFPGRSDGTIDILMSMSDKGEYAIVVRDNGVGFPSGIDFMKTDSLGLQLVNQLTLVLKGTIVMETAGGAAFSVTFRK